MYKVTTQPAEEPLTLTEAKTHLKVEVTADDSLITALIQAAREEAEQYLNLKLITQTVTEKLDCFPSYEETNLILLSAAPVVSVESVKYQDEDDTQQTLSTDIYGLDNYGLTDNIYLKNNKSWPTVLDEKNAVEIIYVVGYGSASDVPQLIKQSMLLMIGYWYENRTDKVRRMPTQAQWCLDKYRNYTF